MPCMSILGATHPTLVRRHGEAYREGLVARVRDLGIEDHVVFFDHFVDQRRCWNSSPCPTSTSPPISMNCR